MSRGGVCVDELVVTVGLCSLRILSLKEVHTSEREIGLKGEGNDGRCEVGSRSRKKKKRKFLSKKRCEN